MLRLETPTVITIVLFLILRDHSKQALYDAFHNFDFPLGWIGMNNSLAFQVVFVVIIIFLCRKNTLRLTVESVIGTSYFRSARDVSIAWAGDTMKIIV